MKKKRVVITGIGILAPGVRSKLELINAIKQNDYQLSVVEDKISDFHRYRYGGAIDDLALEGIPPIVIKQADLATQYAMFTSLKAIEDSRVILNEDILKELGFFFGTELGGLSFAECEYRNFSERGFRYMSPYLSIGMFYSAAIGHLSIQTKAKGFSKTYCSGECSSSMAIGEAYRTIQDGQAKVLIAGGYEKANTESSCLIYYSDNKLAYGKSKEELQVPVPYDSQNNGMILSDGAGMIQLEDYDFALSRDAHIYGEVIAYKQGFSHENDLQIIKNTILSAIEEACIEVQDISYIHGSGLGMRDWDQIDIAVINEIFGKCSDLGAPGNTFGNTLGALGALQVICSTLQLNGELESYIFSTEHKNRQDICKRYALILSRSMDGNIVVLIISKNMN